LPLEENLGLVKNWERTLNACHGKYIALCEGDDYWTDPFKLQKQIDILEKNNNYSMCVSNRKILLSDGTLNDDIVNKSIYSKEDILKGVIPHTQTMVFRNLDNKALCEFLSVTLSGLLSDGDRALAYWCSKFGDIYILPDITAVYRWNGFGVWSGQSEVYREFFSIKMYCNFHKRIEYPDRKLFCSCFTVQCLDFIYYNVRRKIRNQYKTEACLLMYNELSIVELVVYTFRYFKNKLHKK
jgi:glycosyltransferase involved in cell wall biosynthesis